MLWHPAYVGLGSNLDEPAVQVRRAFAALAQIPETRLVRASSLYGSRPMGPVPQPDFINAAAGLLTRLEVGDFFCAFVRTRTAAGADAAARALGPRRIDLDLLVFAQLRIDTPALQLPHPGIVERNFVLYPLAEVAPELPVPGCGRIAELLARVNPEGLWRLESDTAHP